MSTVLVACSSFLNPMHKSWQIIRQVHHLEFADYGDIQSIASERHIDKKVVAVFFADDQTDTFNGSITQQGDIDYYNYLLSLIESRCTNSKSQFIFCFSFYENFDPVRTAKNQSAKQLNKEHFVRKLYQLRSMFSCLFTIDLDECFGFIGTQRAYDLRNWYFAKSRLSNEGLTCLVNSLHQVFSRQIKAAHKVLVLDCDNTLWGGVIGEDGLSGLKIGTDGIGKVFIDFQQVILALKNHGVLLTLASKNNQEDVWKVFDEHESMILQRKDIIAAKINWKEKSANIRELASELGLDLNSFVFWDDNPLEREKTRLAIPEILTVDVMDDIHNWPAQLERLFEFSKFFVSEDDKNKTAQYVEREQFIKLKSEVSDELSFLKSLNLNAELLALSSGNIARAVQLCQKTNQFNLTTQRFSAEKLQEFADIDVNFCQLARLVDRFSDHGIVGLFCLRPLTTDILLIENILLSCRILGRQFEFWLMSEIITIARSKGFKEIIGQFIVSGKNTVARDFLTTCGFSRVTLKHLERTDLIAASHENTEFFSRGVNDLENFERGVYGHLFNRT